MSVDEGVLNAKFEHLKKQNKLLESENARLRGIIERVNEIAHRQYSHSELKPIIDILNEANKGEKI